MFSRKLALLASTTLVTSLAFSGAAQAQIEDEIIVTATKRPQTLQEVPVAVTVTSADTLKKAQILDIGDLQSVVPSLRVAQLETAVNTSFIIRGFGNGSNNPGTEPSVGVFIDGVYRSRSASQIGDLPNLQHIEVLRGPQSTLFGKNASAGVIGVTTSKPSYEAQGFLEAGVGNYKQRVLRGYASGGLTDSFAVSVGGTFNKRDGYSENILGLEDVSNRDRWNLRGQALYEPRDDISIRLIADYGEIDELCCTVTNVTNGPTVGAIQFLGGGVADANDQFSYVTYQNKPPVNQVQDGGISLHVDVDFDSFALTSISSARSNDTLLDTDSDFSTANLLDAVTLDRNIKTFTQEVRLTSTGDNNLDWMVGGYYFAEEIDQLSGLQIGDDFRPYLELLAGAVGAPPGTFGLIEAANGFAPGTFFNGNDTTAEAFTQNNTAYSFFGSADYHVSDRLTFSGGLNYTKDKKNVTGSSVITEQFSNVDLAGAGGFNSLVLGGLASNFPNVAAGCGLGFLPFSPANVAAVSGVASCPGIGGAPGAAVFAGLQANVVAGVGALDLTDPADNPLLGFQAFQFLPQFLGFGNSVEDGRTRDDKLTWTIRGAYEVNDNVNVYASVATGFKASSWNLTRDSRPFAADAGALTAAGLTLPNQSYGTRFAGPENARVFELGMKARFDKGALNVAVFDQRIKDFQSSTFVGTGFVLANAGIQRTRGVEIEGRYSPIEQIDLTAAATFLDPKYIEFPGALGPNGTVVDRSGETVAGIPKTAISVSGTYNHDFSGGATGFVRADYQFESNAPINSVQIGDRKVSTVNGSLGLALENGLGLQIWARNLFNDQYISTLFPGVVQAGTVNGYPSAPRTYGVLLKKEF